MADFSCLNAILSNEGFHAYAFFVHHCEETTANRVFNMSHFTQRIAPIYSQLIDDPDLCDLVKMFVDEMPARIEQLLKDFNAKNWDKLKNTAHNLRGAVGCYGFCEITPAVGKFEQALNDDISEDDIRQTLEELIDLCKRMAVDEM